MLREKNPNAQIKCAQDDDISKHPSCPHGPCLLFIENGCENDGYYACSAYRDKRDCNFYLPKKLLKEKHLNRSYDVPTDAYRSLRQKIINTESGNIFYCQNCNCILLPLESKSHSDAHEIIQLTPSTDPTDFLKPLQNDKAQAQYFFDDKACRFFANCFRDLGINKVVCIGTPRLHGYLLKKNKSLQIQSFLLDLDHRFYFFYNDTHFAWYNMCNNHFFDELQKIAFLKFLKTHENQRLLIVTDPPFGCRTEPIANTIRQLTRLYNNINKLPHQPLPVFWIFPYFSEHYIQNVMPELEMCDYKVNYTNHIAYSDNGMKGNRKLGSPVRIFTNVPLELLKLPVEEGYKYCAFCQHYTSLENRHCKVCDTCPSKNGSTYRHCDLCGICVKPNYIHCGSCRRCTQIEGHNCKEYQRKQRCWICSQVGHIERKCDTWQRASKKFVLITSKSDSPKDVRCFLCGQKGHNERTCPMRSKFIEETSFLGKITINFR